MEKKFVENIIRDIKEAIEPDDWYEDCMYFNDCSICPWGGDTPYSGRVCSK